MTTIVQTKKNNEFPSFPNISSVGFAVGPPTCHFTLVLPLKILFGLYEPSRKPLLHMLQGS